MDVRGKKLLVSFTWEEICGCGCGTGAGCGEEVRTGGSGVGLGGETGDFGGGKEEREERDGVVMVRES